MTPETQTKLIDLARRGAECKAWAEWCKDKLVEVSGVVQVAVKIPNGLWFLTADRRTYAFSSRTVVLGPLPSTGFLDDQLGEFLGNICHAIEDGLYLDSYFWGEKENEDFKKGKWPVFYPFHYPIRALTPVQQLEAAITLIERANKLGKCAHWTEEQAKPYYEAFILGVGG